MEKKAKQQKIIDDLHAKFRKIARKSGLNPGDFPPLDEFKKSLAHEDLSKYPKLNSKLLKKLDEALDVSIPALVKRLNDSTAAAHKNQPPNAQSFNPFESADESQLSALDNVVAGNGAANNGKTHWVVSLVKKTEADNIFYGQVLVNGKLTGKAAKKAFSTTGLSVQDLSKIWKLVDFDHSNQLDADQFALALYLGELLKEGESLPEALTPQMIPPSRRV